MRESRLADNRAELSIPFTSSIVFPITVSLTVSEAKDEPATRRKAAMPMVKALLYLIKLISFCIRVLKLRR